MKVLLPRLRGNSEQTAYLRHEYNVARRLEHESIIRMDEFARFDGFACLVMEYLAVPNMKQWMRLDNADALQIVPAIVENAASALSYMHNAGWIHRDVKPDNFLVEEQGGIKLIDFALARKTAGWIQKLFPGKSKAQGTLSYMSPEQILNRSQDARSDLYSFGCVVYELVCGRPPFTGGNPKDLLNRHLKSPVPSIMSERGQLTGDFIEIIRRLLAKHPDERPTTMVEVIETVQTAGVFTR